MRKNVIMVVLLMILLISCATTSEAIKIEWIGKTKSELQDKMGKPNFITSDGKGGEIWIYNQRMVTNGGYKQVFDGKEFRQEYNPNINNTKIKKMFYINSFDNIYKIDLRNDRGGSLVDPSKLDFKLKPKIN